MLFCSYGWKMNPSIKYQQINFESAYLHFAKKGVTYHSASQFFIFGTQIKNLSSNAKPIPEVNPNHARLKGQTRAVALSRHRERKGCIRRRMLDEHMAQGSTPFALRFSLGVLAHGQSIRKPHYSN